ncbi:MAG: glycosyltransferase family 2 protein [Bacteroidia bacterium]
MNEIKLSVVIIAFNEEINIERCLSSVKDIADDIVVVDSFSTDKTEEICSKYEARFISHKFDGHIEQKNWAITQALYPHILSLDADEALDENLKKNISDAKKNWQFDGYEMNRLTNYCGKWIRHCGWYPDKKMRLWDSRKGKWGGTNPHDKYEMENKNSRLGFLQGDILHYSFYTIEDHIKQINYFSDIASKALYIKGNKANFTTIYFNPIAKFISSYFIRLGFLDGYYGFVISKISAKHTYLKYKKLQLLGK